MKTSRSAFKAPPQSSLSFSQRLLLFNSNFKRGLGGLPWWSSGQDSKLPVPGAQVPSLVRELDPI